MPVHPLPDGRAAYHCAYCPDEIEVFDSRNLTAEWGSWHEQTIRHVGEVLQDAALHLLPWFVSPSKRYHRLGKFSIQGAKLAALECEALEGR